jgi:L-aminopeptidase/D-esterase-like protein
MDGLKVGHFTNPKHGTGVSVFLCAQNATGAYWVCGSAPATLELLVLDPDNSVPALNAILLAGGSAYGLYAAAGVMQYLTEHKLGHPTLHGNVPIVPAAAIYDLAYREAIAPTAENAYQACLAAKSNNFECGQIGAGTGATIGKMVPGAKLMAGGLGCARLSLPSGIEVIAYVVVNCIGDVIDSSGKIVAGATHLNGEFVDCTHYLLSGQAENDLFAHSNTTLAAVFVNAPFPKSALKRIAKMASAGLARAVSPIFSPYDGDIVFCVSVGNQQIASELTVGTLAAQAVREAILAAVAQSVIITL